MRLLITILLVLAIAGSGLSRPEDSLGDYVEIIGQMANEFHKSFEDISQYWSARLSNPLWFNPDEYFKHKREADQAEARKWDKFFGQKEPQNPNGPDHDPNGIFPSDDPYSHKKPQDPTHKFFSNGLYPTPTPIKT
jgi:hypothetical protein